MEINPFEMESEEETKLSIQGFTPREAIAEAKRCLNCANPQCRKGCPIQNEIPQFIKALASGNIGAASLIIAKNSNLPAVCGRVCPHERQCEAQCVLARKQQGIKIGKLEQFIADLDAEMDLTTFEPPTEFKGKVAVIGSGPAGLTVAGDLAKEGYKVTVYEARPEPGGVLMYGIPDFRLPKDVVRREIEKIKQWGIEFKTEVLAGPDKTIDDIFAEGFDAVFIGTGTAMAMMLNVPGDKLPGVVLAKHLLRMVVLAEAGDIARNEVPVLLGDRVAVIGAGNVGIDAARTSLRLGASEVTLIFNRGEADITALRSEYEHAKAEGVKFLWFANTVAYHGTDKVTGLEYESVEMEDGVEKPTGRKAVLPVDKIVLAIGQRPAARVVSTTTGIETNDKGYVITRERPYGMTTRVGVFAGGDVVHEPATVVMAMHEAKKIAKGIDMYVQAKKLMEECCGG